MEAGTGAPAPGTARRGERWTLREGLAVSRRPDGSVQLGTSPRSSVLLTGLTAAEEDLLRDLLRRQSLPAPPLSDPGAGTPRPRPPGHRATHLLTLLRECGALQVDAASPPLGPGAPPGPDADRWAPDRAAWTAAHPGGPPGTGRVTGRTTRRVAVLGGGRLGTGIATTLAAAAVGDVVVLDPSPAGPADVAPVAVAADEAEGSRAAAAARALQRARAGLAPPAAADGEPSRADVVVLVTGGVADAGIADGLLAEGTPHLSVVVRDTDVLIGPFVVPGHTPCLRCLDLHRTDRDPGWPHVVTQVLAGPPRRRPGEETATATAAAGLAALQVLAHLDGAPVTSYGATLELLVPEAVVRSRPWAPHPQCGCAELPLTRDAALPS